MSNWNRMARRIRVPLGFVLAGLYLWLARPTLLTVEFGALLVAIGVGIRAAASGYVRKNEQLLVEVTSEFHGGFNVTAQIMWVESTPEECFIAGCEFCSILSLKQRAQLQRLAEMALAACS